MQSVLFLLYIFPYPVRTVVAQGGVHLTNLVCLARGDLPVELSLCHTLCHLRYLLQSLNRGDGDDEVVVMVIDCRLNCLHIQHKPLCLQRVISVLRNSLLMMCFLMQSMDSVLLHSDDSGIAWHCTAVKQPKLVLRCLQLQQSTGEAQVVHLLLFQIA